ncbi:MAG: sigma-70 family RNA polymerase sigma factor [Candidatus Rokubacteria bacterium]|nr:sigma-70 family RNA polymerase sigma factor [Candidatus Rokubacteria bacterium]
MSEDEKYIDRSLKGDAEAFERLVRKYQGATYALARQRVGSATVAQEVAQDAFVAAYEKLSELKDPRRFGGWLRSITVRRCRMWLRAQRGKPAVLPLPAEGADERLHALPAGAPPRDDTLGIEAMIGKLPAGLRAAALLCFEDELAPAAAAAVLGLKPATLRKRLHDARARLQRQIVARAEKEMQAHLLPKDFARRCVCRCGQASKARERR